MSELRLTDRRAFLASTLLAGAGVSLAAPAPAAAGASAPSPSDAIPLGCIGCGAQGQAILESLVKIPGARPVALCDIWRDFSLDRASGILTANDREHTTHTDYRDMLEKRGRDLAAVIVGTPDCFHAEHTVACLKAGLHVYCESPMSTTLEGARQMAAAARESGKLLQIGHQRRSSPRYRHCVEKLLRELRLLGPLVAVNAQWNQPAEPDRGWPRRYPVDAKVLESYGYGSMSRFRNWRWYRGLGGGPLAAVGTHQLDVLAWFLGAGPSRIMASGGLEHHEKKTHEWPDTLMAVMEFPGGGATVRASYQILSNNGNYSHFERFLGSAGTLTVSELDALTGLYREANAPDWDRWVELEYLVSLEKPEERPAGAGHSSVTRSVQPSRYGIRAPLVDPPLQSHLQNFLDACRGSASLACPPATAYPAAVVAAKIAEAIDSGAPVTVKPEDFAV
jgi:predicted dehydrogenase